MKKWVESGKQPPSAPPITMQSIAPMGPQAVSVAARDENGNALGGIRLAQFAVPTATNGGRNESCPGSFFRGFHQPFDEAKLLRLYPTRAKYVDAINRITDANLKAGYITKEGAEQTKKEATRLKLAGW